MNKDESGQTAELLSGDEEVVNEDSLRQERINLIRKQLAEGSYNISGRDVANKILHLFKGQNFTT